LHMAVHSCFPLIVMPELQRSEDNGGLGLTAGNAHKVRTASGAQRPALRS
jgi:hypothetical protein